MSPSSVPVPLLTAPTGSGKSALALALALERPGGRPVELVSADAFTVYRSLDIGTAKPGPEERAQAPHHLLDVADVEENYDVARYVREAQAAIGDILARGNVPLVVGGTGFYLSGLLRGLPATPPSDPARRAALEAELEERGLDALLAEVAAHRPQELARLERNPRRVLRALEIFRATGRFPSEFGHQPPAFAYQAAAFELPAEVWEAQARARIAEMFRRGWPEEAAWLAARVSPDLLPRPTAWQALGYREALEVWRGTLDVEKATERVWLATRQYARRQATFIRTQLRLPLGTPQEARSRLRSGWPLPPQP